MTTWTRDRSVYLATALLSFVAVHAVVAEPASSTTKLLAHWPLRDDARDVVGGSHGTPRNVRFGDGAARFNGVDSRVEVADADVLDVGTRDFSLAMWVNCETPMASTLGDLLSKFDASKRRGINLHVSGSSPAYSAMSDTRHVHFGIDDDYLSEWKDHGKPWPSNSLIANLVAYQGELYCGIADAKEPRDRAHVFKLSKDGKWIDCGRLGNEPTHHSVMSMIVHDGKLYAGTGTWDWWEAEGAIKGLPPVARTRVFRYDGGTKWTDTGQLGNGTRVLCLASFKGDLYAGIDDQGGGHAFRFDGKQWHDLGAPDGKNFECFQPLGGTLYASTHGNIYAYAGGKSWKPMGKKPHDINQIHSMQVFGGQILLGTWPQGYVLRHAGNDQWSIMGRLGLPDDPSHKPINEVMDMVVYNGKLYAGLIPHAEVYRYESDHQWTMLGSLARRKDWNVTDVATWCRISSTAAQGGRLFVGTGSCQGRALDAEVDDSLGRVFSMQAGTVVSHERDIGGEWTHVTAIRRGRNTELYINGKLTASATLPDGKNFNLTNDAPLTIGSGAQNAFHGAIRDVRLYDGAVDQNAIRHLASRS
jgi:hypothetical protein